MASRLVGNGFGGLILSIIGMVWRQEITPDREPGSAALTSREAGSGRLPLRDTGRRQNQLLHPIGVQGLLRPAANFPLG